LFSFLSSRAARGSRSRPDTPADRIQVNTATWFSSVRNSSVADTSDDRPAIAESPVVLMEVPSQCVPGFYRTVILLKVDREQLDLPERKLANGVPSRRARKS
jgi:hypothetical protein